MRQLADFTVPTRRDWDVFCDFDGTVSTVDVTDSLLEAFALPEWRAVEREWQGGLIGSLDCMRRQVELMRCSWRALDAQLEEVEIDPAFPAFVAHCESSRMPLCILSDGIDYAIQSILDRYRLGHLRVFSNRLESRGPDRYTLDFPYARRGCPMAAGTCKCDLMDAQRRRGCMALLIGDGASDFCAARKADMVLAKAKLLDFCRAEGIPHREFSSFGEVAGIVAELPVPDRSPVYHG